MREKVSDSPKRWQAEHSSHVSPHSGRGAEVHSEDKPAALSVLPQDKRTALPSLNSCWAN